MYIGICTRVTCTLYFLIVVFLYLLVWILHGL